MSIQYHKIRRIVSIFFLSFPVLGFTVPAITSGNWKLGLIAAAMFTPFSIVAYIIYKSKQPRSNGNPAIFIISEVKQIKKADDTHYNALLAGTIQNYGNVYQILKEFYFHESDMRFLQPGNKLPVLINKKNKHEMEIMMHEWKEALNDAN